MTARSTPPIRASTLRRLTASISLCGLLAGCAAPAPVPPPAPQRPPVFEAMARVDSAAKLDLWPGFDPRTLPVAIFDGDRTLLFRHPDPPAGFAPLEGAPGVAVFSGRHPEVRANSTARLGGVTTATVLRAADDGVGSPEALAGLVAHELFHTFREAHHPDWVGDEVELFVYPVDDPHLLQRARLEAEALRRAVASTDAQAAACWAGVALEQRRERFAVLPAGAVAYERGTELNEGLARYVERKVAGSAKDEVVPEDGFAAAAVRERSYATGHALALLLDRLAPGWKETLASGRFGSLDDRLRAVLQGSASTCGFSAAEAARAAERAGRDAAEYRRTQARSREDFLASPGWTIEVLSPAEPLWPQGFDPLNVLRVGEGEVLHTRWLKLGNARGAVEVLDRRALSEAAGEHPLFQGVRRLVVAGLPTEPLVGDSTGVITVTAEGVTARLQGSVVARGRTLTLRVGEDRDPELADPVTSEGSARAR